MLVELNFVGPFSVMEVDTLDLLNAPGIYLWAVQIPSGVYRVTYVGETGRTFFQRVKEHIIQKLGGNYRICDTEALKRGEEVVVWNGLWRSGTRRKVGELLADFETISAIAKANLLVEQLFVAEIECDNELRRHIEWGIVQSLRSSATASSLLPKDIRYRASRDDTPLPHIVINCPVTVEGLPNNIKL